MITVFLKPFTIADNASELKIKLEDVSKMREGIAKLAFFTQ